VLLLLLLGAPYLETRWGLVSAIFHVIMYDM
jgi:hypothetical protein